MTSTQRDGGVDLAVGAFQERFDHPPEIVVRSPGRVNLIGDHTDYTGGLVLPIAIDRAFHVAAAPADGAGDFIVIHSAAFDETVELAIGDRLPSPADPRWSVYARGVITLLVESGIRPPPAQVWIGGDLPLSAGLSSSAACEIGLATALCTLAGTSLEPLDLAGLCRRAENEYAGAPCGIMDQLCCAAARADHALLIDCRDLTWEPVPLSLRDQVFVVIDSGIRHDIAAGEYAKRRRAVEEGLRQLHERDAGITTLRDVAIGDDGRPELPGRLAPDHESLVHHVASENRRVEDAARAAQDGDWAAFGRLMNASHASLRDDYRVSCPEVDELVELALEDEGVCGARMTGGGFGGCLIVLARRDAVEGLRERVRGVHRPIATGEISLFPVEARGGVEIVSA